MPLPGHYASVLRLDERTGDRVRHRRRRHQDGVAERLGRFDTIGIDCVAMNVNDLICVGAEPIAMLDFILCRDADPEICGAIGVGPARAAPSCAGIEIPGGEIAQVGDIVTGGRARPAARSGSSPSTRSSTAAESSPATR